MIRAIYTRTAHAAGVAPATPAGGARQKWWGRGCGLFLCVTLSHGAAASADTDLVDVPSGQHVRLTEILVDDTPGELWIRFRFLAPQIGRNAGDIGYDVSAPDMDHLCESFALPYLTQHQLEAVRVVISLSDQMIDFGASDPAVTQFFEAYRPENALCIWEEF